jgi:hypothetical protein
MLALHSLPLKQSSVQFEKRGTAMQEKLGISFNQKRARAATWWSSRTWVVRRCSMHHTELDKGFSVAYAVGHTCMLEICRREPCEAEYETHGSQANVMLELKGKVL